MLGVSQVWPVEAYQTGNQGQEKQGQNAISVKPILRATVGQRLNWDLIRICKNLFPTCHYGIEDFAHARPNEKCGNLQSQLAQWLSTKPTSASAISKVAEPPRSAALPGGGV